MHRNTIPAALCAFGLTIAAASAAFQETTGQDEKAPAKEATPAKAAPPKVGGTVLFEGDLPEAKELKVSSQAADGCCPPGTDVDRTDMSLLIGEKRGIANVVVTVTVEGAKVELPKEPIVVDQKGCRFQPHLSVVPKGAKVAFLNSDETSHNVRLVALLNDPLNQTVLAGKKLVREFGEAERVRIECDMHTWMKAWVIVTDATHWAVTDENGAFALDGLPQGVHEVTMWHETLGTKTTKITVGDDGRAASVEVKMQRKKKKSRRRRR